MKNLKVVTWDMQGFTLEEFFYHKGLKALCLLDFLANEEADVIALQNLDRKVATMVNEKLREFPEMGYSFDRLKMDDYTILDRLLNNEKNPLIIKKNFLTMSDKPISVNGLFINKVYLKDEHNLLDKFCIVNANVSDCCSDYDLDILARSINRDDYETSDHRTPIIVTGRIDLGIRSNEMLKLQKDALIPNDIKIVKCISDHNKYNYMMTNGFDIEECYSDYDYAMTDMCRPLVAQVKMK